MARYFEQATANGALAGWYRGMVQNGDVRGIAEFRLAFGAEFCDEHGFKQISPRKSTKATPSRDYRIELYRKKLQLLGA